MRSDSIPLEEQRLQDVRDRDDYPSVHERHRIFPAIFEDRHHRRILDSSAGVGVVGGRIQAHYPAELLCNEVSPKCLQLLRQRGLATVSFDLDAPDQPYPFPDAHFDAVISLSTIEHLMAVDHFLRETHRILAPNGCFYLSSPNYAGLLYLPPLVLRGRTFHNPLDPAERYEFNAHVKYFTYRTLLELTEAHGFTPQAVYLGLPQESSAYLELRRRAPWQARLVRWVMHWLYSSLSPRWASEPVICFRKNQLGADTSMPRIKKIIL